MNQEITNTFIYLMNFMEKYPYLLCDVKEVKLIIIPYHYDYRNETKLEEFIIEELQKYGF